MLFWMQFFRAKIAPELQIDGQSVPNLPQNQWKIDSHTGFARLRRNLDFWWQYHGFAWFFRSRRPLKSYKFHKQVDPAKIRFKIAPKSWPRSIFSGNLRKSIPKATPKGTLKSIKNHEKSNFGLQGGPEASQGLPRTPKILKKLLKMTPDGTRKQWQNAGVQTPVPRIVTSVLGEMKNRFCVRDDQYLSLVFF